jgi:hypothetical protein
METTDRNVVIVIGDFDLDKSPFTQRNLELHRATLNTAPELFNFTKAIIVADFPGRFGLIKQCYEELFPLAQDHGLGLAVVVHSFDDFNQVAAIRKWGANGTTSKLFEIDKLWEAAEFAARLRIGPSASNVLIQPSNIKLDDDEGLLFRRAFSDCERIYLEPISGGKASMSVYRVHAWMKQSDVGPLPLPFFAKIGTPADVESEKDKYQRYAELYISFNLRPNIDRHRCVQTRARAALIGNFVDDAVPLREALRTGHGIGALFSLFETTLKGFRLQPFASGSKPVAGYLESFVKDRIKVQDFLTKPDVVRRAKQYGLMANPQDLHDQICIAARNLCCIIGPNHGDLHTGNVMVRGGDSILIDFASTTDGPLTADLATLEASLMFGTESWETAKRFAEWSAFIDEIYGMAVTTLHPPALFEIKPGHFSWLRRSLRELRHVLLACEGSGDEAKVVLAAYLMRYARLDIETLKNEEAKTLAFDRHCYALAVAERIVKGFSTGAIAGGKKA